jgi:hypothetical protein
MEYWPPARRAYGSERVLGAQAGKNLVYFLSPFFSAGANQGSFFSLLHYSITPILRIQLTSAFDTKADKCSLPTAVIYTQADLNILVRILQPSWDKLGALPQLEGWNSGILGTQ